MNRQDLKDYYYSQKWIEETIQRYKEQRQLAEGLRAVVIDGMPKAQNKPNYALEELIDKYNEILKIVSEQQEKQNKIIKQLMLVEVPYKNILDKYYIQGKSLVKVADEMGYSYEHIKHMNGIALLKFEEMGGKNGI